jgi:hypothetical protein
MLRTSLFLLLLAIVPAPLLAQAAGPAIGLGYGISQSRLRTGEALSLEASVPLAGRAALQLRAELLYQWGSPGGPGCEALSARYCIGGTDHNQILGLGAALHVPVAARGPLTLYLPLGVGVYHRRTSTTEAEGPIELCLEGHQVVACPGNPPLQSTSYRTRATVPGYNLGVGLRARISGIGAYTELRLHDLLERDSRAGALPFSFGIRF